MFLMWLNRVKYIFLSYHFTSTFQDLLCLFFGRQPCKKKFTLDLGTTTMVIDFVSPPSNLQKAWNFIYEAGLSQYRTMQNAMDDRQVFKCFQIQGIPQLVPQILKVIWRRLLSRWIKVNRDDATFRFPCLSGYAGIFKPQDHLLRYTFTSFLGYHILLR